MAACALGSGKTIADAVKIGRILYLLGYEFVLLVHASFKHVMCPDYSC